MGTEKFLNKWEGHVFESSSITTEECKEFYKDFYKWLKEECKNYNCEVASYTKGHFFVSGFILNKITNKLAYFSISDLRDYNWNRILYRTAEHIKDTRGGSNNYCYLENMAENIVRITR